MKIKNKKVKRKEVPCEEVEVVEAYEGQDFIPQNGVVSHWISTEEFALGELELRRYYAVATQVETDKGLVITVPARFITGLGLSRKWKDLDVLRTAQPVTGVRHYHPVELPDGRYFLVRPTKIIDRKFRRLNLEFK